MKWMTLMGLCLWAATAQAGTYYVGLNGSDTSGDGSEGSPWRTLQHGVDGIAPGDTVLVTTGTYVGCRIEHSGTAPAWCTLKAAPGAQVLVNAPGPNNKHTSNIELETWDGDGVVAYWVVEGLEVSNAPRSGFDLRGNDSVLSHDLTIRGNTVHDNGLTGGNTGIFLAFIDHAVIADNETYNNGEHGIYCSNSGDYPTVRHNRSHHNRSCGIHMNADASMGNDGIISHGLVEDNIIYENGTAGGAGINMDGVTDSIIRNNLLYNNHSTGIALYQIDAAVPSHDDRLLNNTIIVADDGRWGINITDAGCINNQVFNNIIYNNHSWRGTIAIPSASLPGFQSDYNVLMDRLGPDGDGSTVALSVWQQSGFDTHSLLATPDQLFLGGTDYHLKSGSPAIDHGTPLDDVPADLDGNPRPSGLAFDMGAYEFLSTITPIPTFTPTPTVHMTPTPRSADLNGDGHVDAQDQYLFQRQWHGQ